LFYMQLHHPYYDLKVLLNILIINFENSVIVLIKPIVYSGNLLEIYSITFILSLINVFKDKSS